MPITDRLAKFIGVEGYVAAGGVIVRDLFDAESAGYLSDRTLVMQLVAAKLEQEAETLKAEGWKWVKAEIVRDHSTFYERIHGKLSVKNRARAGAIIRIGHDGKVQIERGLIDPADAKAEAKRIKAEEAGQGMATEGIGMSAALLEDLTAHRTAALRIELARNQRVALAMTVQALASSLLYYGQSSTCLDLQASSAALDRYTKAPQDSTAHQAMADQGNRWGDRLPGEAADLMAWCLDQPQEVLLDLLAFLAALSVNAVQVKQGRGGQHGHADRLAGVLSLDMAQWWTPSVEGFYGRLPKAGLIKAMGEAGVTADAPFDGMKKAEAAKVAAKALAGSGWLPEPFRVQS